jgi:hypothetical protein
LVALTRRRSDDIGNARIGSSAGDYRIDHERADCAARGIGCDAAEEPFLECLVLCGEAEHEDANGYGRNSLT